MHLKTIVFEIISLTNTGATQLYAFVWKSRVTLVINKYGPMAFLCDFFFFFLLSYLFIMDV